MKRRALGKGLKSLIPDVPRSVPSSPVRDSGDGLRLLDIDQIRPNPNQPRREFDEERIAELARSLKERGVLQPVLVRQTGDDQFELIAGERRWRAAQRAGMLKIPAILRKTADREKLELALIENLQREDLNPIDEAEAYQQLMDEGGLTQQEVAERIGKPRATVANALRLLNLPLEVQEMVRAGQVSPGHAKPLAALTRPPLQLDLARRIRDQGLSVRQAESLVSTAGKRAPTRKSPRPRDPNVVAAEENLQRALATKVRIVEKGRGGRVEIDFSSADELQRLYHALTAGTRTR